MKVQQYNINTKSVGGKSIIAIHQGSRRMYIYLIIKCKLINYLFKKIQGLLNARNAILRWGMSSSCDCSLYY